VVPPNFSQTINTIDRDFGQVTAVDRQQLLISKKKNSLSKFKGGKYFVRVRRLSATGLPL
jgi:hypothetical protein